MHIKVWIIALVVGCISLTMFACKNNIKFSQAHVDPEEWEPLACHTDPAGAVAMKKPVELVVTGAEGYKGRVQQTITTADGKTHAEFLVLQGGKFTRENGDKNTHTFQTEGTYSVALKAVDYDTNNLTGSCTFTVFNACPKGQKRQGINLAFVVDNSNSHGKSDCPDAKSTGRDGVGNETFRCSQTNREKAVLYSTRALGQIGLQGNDAISHVGFEYFPLESNSFVPKWYNATTVYNNPSQSNISREILALRLPKGVTPYKEGLEGGLHLFRKTKASDKKNVLFIITDGYPTDQDPAAVLQIVDKLKALNVQIISAMVTNEHSQYKLRSQHRSIMRSNFRGSNGKPWYHSRYKSWDAYFLDLIGVKDNEGLLSRMSSQIMYLKHSSSLTEKVNSWVTTKALECNA